jgi:hypothetical protein
VAVSERTQVEHELALVRALLNHFPTSLSLEAQRRLLQKRLDELDQAENE